MLLVRTLACPAPESRALLVPCPGVALVEYTLLRLSARCIVRYGCRHHPTLYNHVGSWSGIAQRPTAHHFWVYEYHDSSGSQAVSPIGHSPNLSRAIHLQATTGHHPHATVARPWIVLGMFTHTYNAHTLGSRLRV